MFASAAVLVILMTLPSSAFGAAGLPEGTDPVSRLEGRLRSAYMALPRDGQGLPDSSGVRYLARRYLEAEHGWVVKGLDLAPWLRDGHNSSQAASLRASELLALPATASGPLLAALSREPGRGFRLREAAEAVHALEARVAGHDAALMRRARALSQRIAFKRGGAPPGGAVHEVDDPVHKALMVYAVLVYTHDADILAEGLGREVADRVIGELAEPPQDPSADLSGESLETAVSEAAKQATVGSPNSSARAYSGMRHLRNRLRDRHALGWCRRLRGVLSSMDHGGSGQVEFRQAYATRVKNWHFLETPEYLRAVGALAEKGAKGGGPGVLIPNFVSGVNSCDTSTAHPMMFCCPDECEAEILPRLEAAAAGPRIAPRQVWAALSRLVKGDKMVAADKRQELHSQLRALGLRSPDGLLEVHGQPLGRWLHRAFPHRCRGPAARGAPAVVDPALLPEAWLAAGGHLPTEPPEVEEIRAHLQARWGLDGTGTDPRSFAARSGMGLDRELRLLHELHQQRGPGGPPVQQALEDALNVRVLDRSPRAEHLAAAALAAALLGLLGGPAAAPTRRLAAAARRLGGPAAAAAGRRRAAPPAAARGRGGGERGAARAAPGREGPAAGRGAEPAGSAKADESTDAGDTDPGAARAAHGNEGPASACGAEPAGSVKADESTDAGDTDSEAAGELSAEDSDAEREAAAASAGPSRGRAGGPSGEDPSGAAAEAEEPAAARARPLAEAASAGWPPIRPAAAGAGWPPSGAPAACPRGFGPPPGLEPPPGLQLALEALGLGPDWRRPGSGHGADQGNVRGPSLPDPF